MLVLPFASLAHADQSDAVKTYARGDYAGVVSLLEPAWRAGKANIQQRILLARAWLHLKQTDEALAVLRSVLKTDRENPEANALTGRILHDKKQNKEALEYLKRAYRLKGDPATAGVLGRCYFALGEPAKAKVYLEKAMTEDIRDPINSLLLGRICLSRGLGAWAEKYLLLAREAGLDSRELHLALAQAYMLQRKYVGPILIRRFTKPAKPGDIISNHVVLAVVKGSANQYKVCTRYCALYEGYRLIKADPQSGDGLFILASAWLAAGDNVMCAKYLGPLLQRQPKVVEVRKLQARLLLAKKDFDALDQVLQGKVHSPQEAGELYYRAAMMLRADGKRAGAVLMLNKAEAHTPTCGRVLRSLATLHMSAGRRSEAKRYYARLVELFPDAPDIDELRNTLRVLQVKKGARQ